MVSAFTQTVDLLYTTTWQFRRSSAADNIQQKNALFFWMSERNRMTPLVGHREIEVPVIARTNPGVVWIGIGTATPLSDVDPTEMARYSWRHVAVPILRYHVQDMQNRGKAAALNLVNIKLTAAENGMTNEFSTRLIGGPGTVVAGTTTEFAASFDGLRSVIADDPTATLGGNGIAVGGIDSTLSENAWWRNQTIDMTGASFTMHGLKRMRTMNQRTRIAEEGRGADIIVTDTATYNTYEAIAQPQYRLSNRLLVDMGFENLAFAGIPIVWDQNIVGRDNSVAGRMYWIDTDGLALYYDPDAWYEMTDWKDIPNQINDRVAHLYATTQLVATSRRTQGVIYGLDTE